MNSEEVSLQCYNAACGETYKESENTDESCTHHSGHPVFHDLYKGWSCCDRKTTDFREFLDIQGCTKGKHSNVKRQIETVRTSSNSKEEDPTEKMIPPVTNKPIGLVRKRPPLNMPFINLPSIISPSLQKELNNLQPASDTVDKDGDQIDGRILSGTMCKNAGCKFSYVDESSNSQECRYHPGVPIFHEGLKFWTCCQKRTSEFEAFMAQEGCETGTHKWLEPKKTPSEDRSRSCRHDFHQMSGKVVVTIYAKMPIVSKCKIQANQICLNIFLTFGGNEAKEFEQKFELFGEIDVHKSVSNYFPNKVEVTLSKVDETQHWPRLTI